MNNKAPKQTNSLLLRLGFDAIFTLTVSRSRVVKNEVFIVNNV